MSKSDFSSVIKETQKILIENEDWIIKYEKYIDSLFEKELFLKDFKNDFYVSANLNIYMNISNATSQNPKFDLRYLGQNIAQLIKAKTGLVINTKKYDEKNKRDFNYNESLHNEPWKGEKAIEFRNNFSKYVKRISTSNNKENEEHRVESLLLDEFSKPDLINKKLGFIKPIMIFDKARFQMPVPISANSTLKFCTNSRQGGIDILARVGNGPNAKLTVIELKKDSKLKPLKVITQALHYATFIRELLRSQSGKKWWKFFGFTSSIDKPLSINVVCALPFPDDNNYPLFTKQIIPVTGDENGDKFILHYLFFQEENNEIIRIETSLLEKKESQ